MTNHSIAEMYLDILSAMKDQREAPLSPPAQKEWRCLDGGLSNLDHLIEPGVESELREGECYCEYTAWDFYGEVWYENDQFHCFVLRYRTHVDTVSATDLTSLMEECSDRFGDE